MRKGRKTPKLPTQHKYTKTRTRTPDRGFLLFVKFVPHKPVRHTMRERERETNKNTNMRERERDTHTQGVPRSACRQPGSGCGRHFHAISPKKKSASNTRVTQTHRHTQTQSHAQHTGRQTAAHCSLFTVLARKAAPRRPQTAANPLPSPAQQPQLPNGAVGSAAWAPGRLQGPHMHSCPTPRTAGGCGGDSRAVWTLQAPKTRANART